MLHTRPSQAAAREGVIYMDVLTPQMLSVLFNNTRFLLNLVQAGVTEGSASHKSAEGPWAARLPRGLAEPLSSRVLGTSLCLRLCGS